MKYTHKFTNEIFDMTVVVSSSWTIREVSKLRGAQEQWKNGSEEDYLIPLTRV
jgi:hypothetical protein